MLLPDLKCGDEVGAAPRHPLYKRIEGPTKIFLTCLRPACGRSLIPPSIAGCSKAADGVHSGHGYLLVHAADVNAAVAVPGRYITVDMAGMSPTLWTASSLALCALCHLKAHRR
jgi:hypothetical protein